MNTRGMRSIAFGCALALAGCATQPAQQHISGVARAQDLQSVADMVNTFALNPPSPPVSDALAKAVEAVSFLKQMDLPKASRSANTAVQLDNRNSYLHFLNGFIYHLQARQGDTQKTDLAVEGYRLALQLDLGNWIAQEFLGLAYLDLKEFTQAKEQFTEVLLMSPDSTASIYGLMRASYLTGDAATACAMADRYRQLSPQPGATFVKSSVAVFASCGNFAAAERMQSELEKLNVDPADVERTNQRLTQWKEFYRAPADESPLRLAAAFSITHRDAPPDTSTPPTYTPPPALSPAPSDLAPPSTADVQSPGLANEGALGTERNGSPGMVLVDVVMVSTQETITTTKGVNLLDALTLQLGSVSAPAFSKTFDSSSGKGNIITRTVTIPALAYSLNIANASSATNEVLARPTLAAIEGQPSEFFAGTNLNAGVVSTSSLGSVSVIPVDKRFGVKLAITPTFLADGMIQLKVDAQRTFLNADTNNAGFSYRLDIAETTTNANVVMKAGDTLMLSGLSEKQTSSTRSGVPVLQDVPVVQYLFSNKRDIDFQRSVLILITPRQSVYSAKSRQNTSTGESESLTALRERMGFSAKTPANIEAILNHLATTGFYRQFRQGDVALERWDRSHTTGDRLRQALGFIYY